MCLLKFPFSSENFVRAGPPQKTMIKEKFHVKVQSSGEVSFHRINSIAGHVIISGISSASIPSLIYHSHHVFYKNEL